MSHLFVLGAGHVGLATAVGLVRLGHRVTVADIDPERITKLRAGQPPNFEPGLAEAIGQAADRGDLAFTTRLAPPDDASCSFVCVPTPTGPDGPLSTVQVEQAVLILLGSVSAEHVIVVRSTLPLDGPERLRQAIGPRPVRAAITTNPEFLREGQALDDFANPTRVVVGWLETGDAQAASRVAELYRPLGAPLIVADADSVALIKLLSNVFLGMKIAYANEVARIADRIGADARLVIEAVGLDPRIGTSFMQPGPGFGGGCLPEQALAIALETATLGIEAPLMGAIHRANRAHQASIVQTVASILGRSDNLTGVNVAVLGLAFKANTDDVRESPGITIATMLRGAGAEVLASDPRAATRAASVDPDLRIAASPLEAVDDADVVVVATEWAEYGVLDWAVLAPRMRGRHVYDTRGIVDIDAAEAAGLEVTRLGGTGRPQRAPTGSHPS